jgi:hypothetical protein
MIHRKTENYEIKCEMASAMPHDDPLAVNKVVYCIDSDGVRAKIKIEDAISTDKEILKHGARIFLQNLCNLIEANHPKNENCVDELREVEQLRTKNKELEDTFEKMIKNNNNISETICKLLDENKQLKEEIEELRMERIIDNCERD